MNSSDFVKQLERLKLRFGERAFDSETIRLIRREIETMAGREFELLVDGLIATRPHHKAPLVADFREGRLAVEKRILASAAFGATKAMTTQWSGGLQSYLKKEFPGCKTLAEAVEVRKFQIKMQKIEDPNYNPLTDPRFA